MPSPPLTQPITWTSDDPHLSGNFAPVGTEVDASDLAVVSGRIPDDLRGAYMRNGPEPTPSSPCRSACRRGCTESGWRVRRSEARQGRRGGRPPAAPVVVASGVDFARMNAK